ncbi:MAG: site-2 protease family protein [Clostridia bacterium]|nr:site-2 protease family protein [Clostridia bacterium]
MFWWLGATWQQLFIGLAMRLFIILLILPLHECAHGWMAYKLGDDTAKRMGRLTLNPLPHIDYVGAACIILVGFGWAKPVPVNPWNFRDRSKRKAGMALTALAGPASNFLAAIVGAILLRAVLCFNMSYDTAMWVAFAFNTLISVNLSLAIFNLIPIHPLDGSRILSFFLPDKYSEFMERNGQLLNFVLIILIMGGALSNVLSFLVNGAYSGIMNAVDWLFRVVGL